MDVFGYKYAFLNTFGATGKVGARICSGVFMANLLGFSRSATS
jgi:hypothetical protein